MSTTPLAHNLLQQLQGGGIEQIASQLGLQPAQAQSAVATALPLLMGALGRNAQQPEGADALLGALQRDHAPPQGGLDLGGLLGAVLGGGSGGAQTDGAGILGHIFGGNTPQAAQGLGQATGLDSGRSSQLLQILAPIVLSFLAQRFLGGGAGNAAQLSQALGDEHRQARAEPGLSGLLGSVLDQDGDGQLGVGDLLKLGSGLFGNSR
ncbi:DUF937 domain-containing protein [Stenotrophomonas sp. HITSZ_GD]|uniref:DUF937 domain-containing protein n=1 Tax=Stenotrophomonas sp. HITSZ_GD TaxID=3037248 RepID=UPI00240D5C88|nr:DUF937 domain-containing protein [Stenotrophomonas sp. HITSZ_GD]MDG2525003.1 DUF937 domain-containing protein [Stenotrophomonas sp. HITSZ_GD]